MSKAESRKTIDRGVIGIRGLKATEEVKAMRERVQEIRAGKGHKPQGAEDARRSDLGDDFHRRHVAGTTMDRPWPCADQTPDQIEHDYRTAPEGSEAAVREPHAGFLKYDQTVIEG
jgi:hypothetical protein